MSENKLNVIDLHKHYGEHEVLKGVSLQANAGDVISIIGSSGSGKSTFWCATKTVSSRLRTKISCACCARV